MHETWQHYTLLGKKAALFLYVLVHTFEKIAASAETCKKFVPHFTRYDMASTLTICFLRHCLRSVEEIILGLISSVI